MNTDMTELTKLERTICKGLQAYDARNRLIADLVASGVRQADVARHINAVRKKMGAPPITPDAVAATIKRVEKHSE